MIKSQHPEYYLGLSFLAFLVIISACFVIYFSVFAPELIDSDRQDYFLPTLSLGYFLCLMVIGLQSMNLAYFTFPIIILTVPNSINDLFVSVYFAPDGYGEASNSLINHIDLFAITFLLKARKHHSRTSSLMELKMRRRISFLILSTLVFSLLGQLVSASQNIELLKYIFLDTTQLRYLCYLVMLLSVIDASKWRIFKLGTMVGLLALLIESFVFSLVYDLPYITSGNFGTNTLAVTLSVIFLALIFDSGLTKFRALGAIALILCISYLTGTRSVLYSIFCSLFLVNLLYYQQSRPVSLLLSVLFVAFLLVYLDYNLLSDISEMARGAFQDYRDAARELSITPNNSSVITRISLLAASSQIIMEYPGGVGLSGWHYLRKDFGFDLGILIDPHNNYMLSFMSFGIIGGIVYQLALVIYPIILALNARKTEIFLILLFVSICNLTNSNFQKHQFFIMYCLFLAFFLRRCVELSEARKNLGQRQETRENV